MSTCFFGSKAKRRHSQPHPASRTSSALANPPARRTLKQVATPPQSLAGHRVTGAQGRTQNSTRDYSPIHRRFKPQQRHNPRLYWLNPHFQTATRSPMLRLQKGPQTRMNTGLWRLLHFVVGSMSRERYDGRRTADAGRRFSTVPSA